MSLRRKPRRGVLLLIVLSLLVLFVLIGITFIVVATQYTKAAKAFARHELRGDPPRHELDEAVALLLRGSADYNNLLFRHNLLQDLYGSDGFEGVVLNVQYGGFQGQQFLKLIYADLSRTARASDHYYNGSVLTLVDGQGARHSTRILRYTKPAAVGTVRSGELIVEAFEDLPTGFVPAVATKIVVNGKAFNGTGDGFNLNTGKLDQKWNGMAAIFQPETALMPFYQPVAWAGDGDESWDAADYQNVFLARLPSQIPLTGVPAADDPLIPSFHRPFLLNHMMQRIQAVGGNWSDPPFSDLRRYLVARPLPDAHPLFTGGNPRFSAYSDLDSDSIPDFMDLDNDGDGQPDVGSDGLLNVPLVRGPWDVDNDGDSVADSVWVDFGAPVKTTPDGRRYKPLFAVLCVDLDGRINVNAHGTREAIAMLETRRPPIVQPSDPYAALVVGQPQANLSPVTLGQGYGPAEIRLDRVIPPGLIPTVYPNLVLRRYQPRSGLPENPPTPGWPDYPPGQPDQFIFYPNNPSLLSSLQVWGLASDYRSPQPGEANLYQTPPDLHGTGGVYLDLSGQPRFVNMTDLQNFVPMGWPHTLGFPSPLIDQWVNATQDDPYELNLVSPQGSDSPFDEADLEQLLRYNDLDAQIFPTTLGGILGNLMLSDNFRRRLTTRSFDIPNAPAIAPDSDERSDLVQLGVSSHQATQGNFNPVTTSTFSSGSLVEYAIERLVNQGGFAATGPNDPLLLRQLNLLLAPEIREGRRLDLNRLFGNGIDESSAGDPGFGVIDEPTELLTQVQTVFAGTPFQAVGQFATTDPNYVDAARSIDNSQNPYFSRQVFARHLYCLAMLAMDDDFLVPSADLNDAQRKEATARRIAQWAINVVDFRDNDAIMTPFEYDVNPFDADGWSVDDDFTSITADEAPGSDRRVVWGCEYPDLLITETMAFHDRRVKDTDWETPDPNDGPAVAELRFPAVNADDNPNNNVTDYDPTLDQLRIPQGSLFIELYATGNRSANNAVMPRELYTQDGRLDLGRVVTDASGASPVWRVAIAQRPDDLSPQNWARESEVAVLLPSLLIDTNPNDPITFLSSINDRSWQAQYGNLGLPDNQITYDRFILFSDGIPNRVPAGVYYYNRRLQANTRYGYGYREPQLPPGAYAVVGPRPATAVGATQGVASNQPSMPASQRIVLLRDTVAFYDSVGAETTERSLNIIVGADPPPTWTDLARTAPIGIGINVSEPNPGLNYYREPSVSFPDSGLLPDVDPGAGAQRSYQEPYSYYDDLDTPQRTLPDVPFDNPPTNGGPAQRPLQERPDYPLTGTHPRFRVALLQRLADPTRSWDAATNPYITIDSQAIDLTVFNGEENSDVPPNGWIPAPPGDVTLNPALEGNADTPYDIVDDPALRQARNLAVTFQSRERGASVTTVAQGPNVWNPISTEPISSGRGGNAYFNWNLRLTLGGLNTTFGPRRGNPPEYFNVPQRPFPWLTWNNRPFANHLELMQVPSSPPWRLPFEMRRVNQPGLPLGEFFHAPFGHLLNFFHDDPGGPDPNLGVLLDWVDVPSRFDGTQKWVRVNPSQLLPELRSYATPFNKLPRFREPGKVNINTIPDDEVWAAVDAQPAIPSTPNPSLTPWADVQRSLAGPAAVKDRPAFYANPMRAAATGDLMPRPDLEQPGVEATWLRKHPTLNDRMLFNFPILGNDAVNPETSSYFRYHKLQRLGNLLTTHSNVFAVWITVGYFEVLPWDINGDGQPDYDPAHPDGFQLGAEIGSDVGAVNRHRAFYLIDRSIPVGYQRGEDLNVKNAILLRRMIE